MTLHLLKVQCNYNALTTIAGLHEKHSFCTPYTHCSFSISIYSLTSSAQLDSFWWKNYKASFINTD